MSTARRARFAKFIECYHNSFTGAVDGVFSHSPGFIAKVVEAVAAADPALAAATLRLDPRLTSTDQGAMAFSVAKAVSEDKQLAPHFIDIELVESTMVVTFEPKVDIEKAKKVLSEVGRVGVIAKPGDLMSDSVRSDLFMVVIEAAPAVSEAVVAEMKKKMPPFIRKGKGDKKKDDDKGKDDKDGDEKGDEKSDDEDDGCKERYSDAAECAHLGLAEAVFSDAALAKCTASDEGVRAIFADLFGAKATAAALAAKVGESLAPADAPAQRNRLLRLLTARGYLPSTCEAKPAGLGEAVLDKAVTDTVKVTGVAEAAAYEAAVDELALALDAVVEDTAVIFKLFVERVLDTGVEKLGDERKAALVARLKEAAAKDDKSEGRVVARCLRALSNTVMFERGAYRSAAVLDASAAWGTYIAEATKKPAAPADPLATVMDELLGS